MESTTTDCACVGACAPTCVNYRSSPTLINVSLTIDQLCALVASDENVSTEHWQVQEVIETLDALGLLVRSKP